MTCSVFGHKSECFALCFLSFRGQRLLIFQSCRTLLFPTWQQSTLGNPWPNTLGISGKWKHPEGITKPTSAPCGLSVHRWRDGAEGHAWLGWVQLEWTANAKDHSHWSAVLANGTFSWCVNVPFFTFCEREHRNFSKGHRWQRVAHEQTRQQFTSRSFRHRTFSFEVLLITETNEPALSTHADSSYFGPVLQNSIISTVAADYPAKWRVSPWTGSWYQRERDTPH